MNTFSQWVHQHDLLLLCAAVVGSTGVLVAFRWRSPRLWAAWLGLTGISLAVLLALRTPAASLSEHRGPHGVTTVGSGEVDQGAGIPVTTPEYSELNLGSVEAIKQTIAAGGKPTLVEVYADYGLS